MSGDPLPPIDPKAQNAINQVGKDESELKAYQAQMAADIRVLRSFLSSLGSIVKREGPQVALMMLMSKGFTLIDEVKNDNFVTFSAKLNINTDYQTMGSLSEGYVNEGASKDGISRSDTYSLYRLLQKLQGAAKDINLDTNTGGLVGSSADTVMNILFNFKGHITNDLIDGTRSFIDAHWNPTMDNKSDAKMSQIVKEVDNAFDQISSSTNSSSQTLQIKSSVASNSYKSFMVEETKNFSQWSSLVGDINRHTSQA